MKKLLLRFEIPILALTFLTGSAFLLKMCYQSLLFNTIFVIVFLKMVHSYCRFRFKVSLPISLLILVFLALQIDALGNYFGMYGHQFGPMQYDEFSHLMVQVLVTPPIIWLLRGVLRKSGNQLSPRLTSFVGATLIFSLSAFYEIIELWDELYFHGHRIWGIYDTATDLQWDLLGILIGVAISTVLNVGRVTVPAELRRKPQLAAD